MSQSLNNQNDNQKKTWTKRWKNKKSAKKQNQETNIALVNSNTLNQMTQETEPSKKLKSDEHKGPFLLEAKNSRILNKNFKAWSKSMEIHIGTLYPEFSKEILPDQDGIRHRYVMPERSIPPELAPSTTANSANNNFVSQVYQTELADYLLVTRELNRAKLKVIPEIRKYLETS